MWIYRDRDGTDVDSVGEPTRAPAGSDSLTNHQQCCMLLVTIVNISILIPGQEKLNEAIMVMNKSLQVCQSFLWS